MDELTEFRGNLLDWFSKHRRDLPWRRTADPYAIWISEIMLQQTRVAAVIPYYERFLERFPTIDALACAEESELLAHWAGLGYYYRARNLQKAAQAMRAHGGFPTTYAEIRRLPGVGDYTASAVASIAFALPHAVLDGNVLRVLSRVDEDATNIASLPGRKHFAQLANAKLDGTRPGAFNQAMMELGATVCLPGNPQCLLCPVARLCRARASGRQRELPVKLVERRSVEEHRTVFWIERRGSVLLWQREASSRLMPGFWELPEQAHVSGLLAGRKLGSFRHAITFHNYRFDLVETQPPDAIGSCRWVALDTLASLPLSTVLRKAKRIADRRPIRNESAVAGTNG
ncbi:MAG: A/G-specific adenine glycosylase [Acidobacteriaceae bacterium]|nr:A/G-specific adenine glycosylase [Acidobacteriaceae bacterium]